MQSERSYSDKLSFRNLKEQVCLCTDPEKSLRLLCREWKIMSVVRFNYEDSFYRLAKVSHFTGFVESA